MMFTSALLSLVSLALAAPAPVPQIPSGPNVIPAMMYSQYAVSTGAISANTAHGKIYKSGQSSDITTLVSFEIPAAAAGRTCKFNFYLDGSATRTGSGLFDVYSSLYPVAGSTSGWGPGNGRNQHMGRMQTVQPGYATVVEDVWPKTAAGFPCGEASKRYGYELVGVYDKDNIEWSGATQGVYLTWW